MFNFFELMDNTDYLKALVHLRGMYKSFKHVAENQGYGPEEKFEAKELTKDGFYMFVNRMMTINKGEENDK